MSNEYKYLKQINQGEGEERERERERERETTDYAANPGIKTPPEHLPIEMKYPGV